MEEENVPHSVENIDFQVQGERLEELVRDNNSSEADESNEVAEEESEDGSDQRIVDFIIEGQNYFALGKYIHDENDTNSIDQMNNSLILSNSLNLADCVVVCNSMNDFTLEMEEENVPHSVENIDFQVQGERLEELVSNNNSSEADESNEVAEEESEDGSDQRIVDFIIEGQNYFALGKYINDKNDTNSIDQMNNSLILSKSLNLADCVVVCNSVNGFTLEMEEENVPHFPENITFRLHEQRLDELVHDYNSSDADESKEFVEEESNDGNDQGNVDFATQGQNYLALGKYGDEDNNTETIDQIDHSSSPYNSSNLADGAIECNNVNEFAWEMEKENVPDSAENIYFQVQEERLEELDADENNEADEEESHCENDHENHDHTYVYLCIHILMYICYHENNKEGNRKRKD